MTATHITGGTMALAEACEALKGHVETVALSGKKLGKAGVEKLAEALKNNRSLQVLQLAKTGIGPPELQVLQPSLTKHRKLKRLELAGNAIGNKGVQILVEILKGNKHLLELNLAGNCIETKSIEAFGKIPKKHFRLTGLSLSNNPLNRMVPIFCQTLLPCQTLVHLNLQNFNRKRVLSEDATTLLNLGALITGCSSLQYLNLAQNHLEVNALSSIALSLYTNSTLTELNLSANPLLSFVAMKKDKALGKAAKIAGKAFDKVAGSFIGVPIGGGMDSEELHYNRDGRGLQKLGLALTRNEKIALKTLHLDKLFRNSISDSEEPDIRWIIHCASLQELRMAKEKMSPTSHCKLQMALRSREEPLEVSLPKLPYPYAEEAARCEIKELKKNKVQTLDLSGIKLTPDDFLHLRLALQKNTSLTELNLSGNDLSRKAYAGLRDLALGLLHHTSLQRLILRRAQVDDRAASVLATLVSYNPSITKLDLCENKIKIEGFKEFLFRLPYSVKGPTVPFGRRDLLAIQQKGTLPEVELYQVEEYPPMVEHYLPVCDDQMRSLQSLCLGGNPLLLNKLETTLHIPLIAIFERNTTLQALDFSHPVTKGQSKKLKDSHWLPFDQFLKKNTSLTSLGLEGYKMSEEAKTRIGAAIGKNIKKEKKRREKNEPLENTQTSSSVAKQKSSGAHGKKKVASEKDPLKNTSSSPSKSEKRPGKKQEGTKETGSEKVHSSPADSENGSEEVVLTRTNQKKGGNR